MLPSGFRLWLLTACLGASVVCAQNGDKAGETQREVVPADKIPPAPVLSPDEALKTFQLAPGFRMELVAAEPLVQSPVQAQFDHQGRLWIVEMTGYMPTPDAVGEQEPTGSIVILTDTNGDGRMDTRAVFLDGLVMPRAVMLVAGGALVAEPPQVWFARDNDGDGKADEKTEAFANYAPQNDPKLGPRSNPEHASNGLMWALDNWVYSANHTTRYRWTGDPTVWHPEFTIFRGQWGLAQDDAGRLYFNSNSDPLRADFVPSHYLARNKNLRQPFGANVQLEKNLRVWPGRVNPGVNRGYQPNQLTPEGKLATFTGACGPVVYRGDQFGPEFVGDVFLAEPTGNLIRRERIVDRDGLLTATNAHPQGEFLTSTDERFRPVNLHNGPDGTLYVVDFYRGLIQHRIYLTSYLRKQIESRNLQSPVNLGRIWRVVRTGRPLKRDEALAARPSNEELLNKLSHPNGFWRDTAQRMLVTRGDPVVAPALRKLAKESENPSALGRLHALWTLEGLDSLDLPTLQAAIADSFGKVRTAALRLTETFFAGPQREAALNVVFQRAGFIPLEEQIQLFFTLGQIGSPQADTIIKILLMNAGPGQLRFDAALSSLGGRELEFLEALVKDPACATMAEGHAPLLSGLARCVTYEGKPDRLDQLLHLASVVKPGEWQQLAILDGLLGTVPPARAGQPTKTIRLKTEPRALAAFRNVDSPEMKRRLERLDSILVWPGKPGMVEDAPVTPLSADEEASFNRGKEVYTLVCAACHQPHGNGQEGLAPPLTETEWTLGPDQRLIRIVIHGLRDEITVKGVKWMLNMPAFAEAVDDQQIADVLTYIRREWGHTAAPVKPETVKAVRAATAGREDSWTEAELLKIK
jgi:putative membrane-bound dehydrogenase-like protein